MHRTRELLSPGAVISLWHHHGPSFYSGPQESSRPEANRPRLGLLVLLSAAPPDVGTAWAGSVITPVLRAPCFPSLLFASSVGSFLAAFSSDNRVPGNQNPEA